MLFTDAKKSSSIKNGPDLLPSSTKIKVNSKLIRLNNSVAKVFCLHAGHIEHACLVGHHRQGISNQKRYDYTEKY